MTEQQSTEAGREADRDVAEQVFGRHALAHTSRPLTHGKSWDGYWSWTWMEGDIRIVQEMPRFSTSISAAWQVVEHIREHGDRVYLKVRPEGDSILLPEHDPDATQLYCAHIVRQGGGWGFLLGYAETMPLAISRAALKWVAEKGLPCPPAGGAEGAE